jgi:hypothetical protein
MLRPTLIPILAIAALLTAAPVAASPAANQEDHPAAIEFALDANNGLRAELETSGEGIYFKISRRGRFASYEVQGEATEAGLKARFGKLGSIDVTFKPTKTRTEEPPKGCTGRPSTDSEGLFVGTIDFTGEFEYVRVEATQAEGTMWVNREYEWKCSRHEGKGPPPVHVTRRPSSLGLRRGSAPDKEPATLGALSKRCGCFFAAYATPNRRGRGQTTFVGAKFEKVEGMEIARGTVVNGDPSTFVFDHEAGTAQVHPPHPFSGSGIFKRHPHGRDLWRSTIQVPLLGADPLTVGDPGYRARLVRALPGGE